MTATQVGVQAMGLGLISLDPNPALRAYKTYVYNGGTARENTLKKDFEIGKLASLSKGWQWLGDSGEEIKHFMANAEQPISWHAHTGRYMTDSNKNANYYEWLFSRGDGAYELVHDLSQIDTGEVYWQNSSILLKDTRFRKLKFFKSDGTTPLYLPIPTLETALESISAFAERHRVYGIHGNSSYRYKDTATFSPFKQSFLDMLVFRSSPNWMKIVHTAIYTVVNNGIFSASAAHEVWERLARNGTSLASQITRANEGVGTGETAWKNWSSALFSALHNMTSDVDVVAFIVYACAFFEGQSEELVFRSGMHAICAATWPKYMRNGYFDFATFFSDAGLPIHTQGVMI